MPNELSNELLAGVTTDNEPVAELEPEGSDLELAFADFDDPNMPLEVRAEALKLIVELVS